VRLSELRGLSVRDWIIVLGGGFIIVTVVMMLVWTGVMPYPFIA
jgi:hypothetical protein